MKLVISSQKTLQEARDTLDLPAHTSTVKLVRKLIKDAAEAGDPECRISILLALLPESYRHSYTTFSRQLKGAGYPEAHCFVKNLTLVVYAGAQRLPTTFKAKVIRALQIQGQITTTPSETPESYYKRPQYLIDLMQSHFQPRIHFTREKKNIIWKLNSTQA